MGYDSYAVSMLSCDLLLLWVFWTLSRTDPAAHLRYWTLAWIGLPAAHVGIWLSRATGEVLPGIAAVLSGVGVLVATGSMLVGTCRFVGRSVPSAWLYVAIGVALWTGATLATGQSHAIALFPLLLCVAAVLVFTGVALLRSPQDQGLGRLVAGWALIGWGLHQADFPVLYFVEGFRAWGIVIGFVLELVVGVGFLLLHFNRNAAELQASERRFRSIFENAIEGLFTADAEGRFLSVNPSLLHLLGYADAATLRASVRLGDLVGGRRSSANAEGAGAEGGWGGDDLHGIEVDWTRPDGGGLVLSLFARRVERPELGGAGHDGFVRDVTTERRLQEQLLQSQKMEAIGRLAGGVAHDFNNILTGIIGHAELAQNELPPDHPVHPDLVEIRKSGARAAALTNQLLAFARKQIINPRVIQPNEILGQSEKMLRRLLGEDVELVFIPGANLHNIRSDPGQLDQIFMNLAVNARDAMPNGGKLTIETSNVWLENEPNPMQEDRPASGEFVMVAISDNGVGMDASTRQRLFEPFFSTKAKGAGTGLGLSTVYGIVRQNGGFIKVYSEPGHGSTFKVYFPPVKEPPDPVLPASPTDVPNGTETILLVEDDAVVRELARKILSGHGYTVLEAGEGNEAILLSRRYSGTIHLLLTDVVMPSFNGRALFERLKAERPGLVVLFMSGYTENVIAHHGVLDKGTNFLQKPFNVRSLAQAVRTVLTSNSRSSGSVPEAHVGD